jgi:hypothetical protein
MTEENPKGKIDLDGALNVRLLPDPDPQDPDRCELHRFILKKVKRFQCSETLEEWVPLAADLRRRFLHEIYMRGYPSSLIDDEPKVIWKDIIDNGHGYRIRKLLYEGFPGMWIPALLYQPDGLQGKVPCVLNPNGHHTGGKAMDYKQARCINLAKRGMLAMSTEFIGMGELSVNVPHNRIAHMDLCGKSGVGIFYLAMKRGLDVLLSHPSADLERVAMTGLSGGGWQTIVLSALDERIRVTIPVAGHSPIWQRPSCDSDIGDMEQNPSDICTVADYDALTALCAPRPTLLIYNKNDDCCFKSGRTRVSIYEPVKPVFDLYGVAENLEFYENTDPGTHNYESDNRSQLYKFLNKHFSLDTPDTDLPYEEEILSETQLEVGTPVDNSTLSTLVIEAARDLPTMSVPPEGDKETWLIDARKRLTEVIYYRDLQFNGETVGEGDGFSHHRLHIDDSWTVPATVFAGRNDKGTHLVISDGGRRNTLGIVEENLASNKSVLVADVFGTGESPYPEKYQMILAAVGERPLGVMVGQILGLLRWSRSVSSEKRAGLSALGMRTSFASLCAAALHPEYLSELHLEGVYPSLKHLIRMPLEYESAPGIFCFGLLEALDVRELFFMTEDIPISWAGHGEIKPVARRPD